MACCKSGSAVIGHHPQGSLRTLGPIECYFSLTSTRSRGTVLVLPDGFGLALHNKLLADKFAAQGWNAIIPDYFQGDPIPICYLNRNKTGLTETEAEEIRNFDIQAWVQRHPHSQIEVLLKDFLLALLPPNTLTQKVFAVGYCFGGKHALRLASGGLVAAAAFHPSSVTPDDLDGRKAPLFIGCAEKDEMVSPTLVQDLRVGLEREGNNFEIKIYEDMKHGFAARPNHEDSKVRMQCDAAFDDAIEFLISKL